MKTLTERILRTFPAFRRHKTVLDMTVVLALGLIAPIIGQLARSLGDEETTCMGTAHAILNMLSQAPHVEGIAEGSPQSA